MIEYVPEIVVSEGIFRLEAQRRAYACLGFLEAPEPVEHTSEFGVALAKSGFRRNASRKLVSASSSTVEISQRSAALVHICGMSP